MNADVNTQRKDPPVMKKISWHVVTSLGAALLFGVMLLSSCTQSAPTTPAVSSGSTPSQANDVGRFTVVVVSDGTRGTVVMMVDSREGATWIYRPPQGSAINGFWSDIPRLTYAPEFWRNVFAQQQAAPSTGGATGAPAGGTTVPAPAPATPPSR